LLKVVKTTRDASGAADDRIDDWWRCRCLILCYTAVCNCIAVYFFIFVSSLFLLLFYFLCYHCSMGSVP